MRNLLVRLIGFPATVLHGDPCVFDRWVWIRRRLRPGPLRTLDAGCGSGVFTLYAVKIGNEAVGLSFDARNNAVAGDRARLLGLARARFVQADLRELDQLSPRLGQFDQILRVETIEHLLNDRKLLADLARLLKPRGRFLLTTPYKHYRRLLGDRLFASEREGGHVRWGYTHEEMRRLFAECGLEVVEESFVSGWVSQQLTNGMRLLSRVHPLLAWGAILPLRPLQVLDEPVTRLLSYPYLCIGVVGVKKSL